MHHECDRKTGIKKTVARGPENACDAGHTPAAAAIPYLVVESIVLAGLTAAEKTSNNVMKPVAATRSF